MVNDGRRSILKAVSGVTTAGIAGLAGCMGSADSNGERTGGGGGAASADRTLMIAATFGEGHPQVALLKRWGENLLERTDGELTLEYVSIGGEADHMSATSAGSIAGHGTSMTALTQAYGTEYGFLEAPLVVKDWPHFQRLADEYVYADGGFNAELIEKANQRILGSAFRGFRGTTANRAVNVPQDITGVKMRLPEFKAWVRVWSEIGAQVTPVPYDDLYQALQTGVVSASESPIAQFVDASLYEVQSHFSQTDHLLQTQNWVINEEIWQDLDRDTQQAMQSSLKEAIKWTNETTRKRAEELFAMVQEDYGVTVVSSDDVNKAAFRTAAQPQLEKFFRDRWKPTFEEVQSLA